MELHRKTARYWSAGGSDLRYVGGVFGLFLLYFILQKVLFLLVYAGKLTAVGTTAGDIAAIFLHGLRHDAAVAAYLAVLPLLLTSVLCIAGWGRKKVGRTLGRILHYYYLLISLVLGLIYTADLVLFGHWGFRLDATPLFYLRQPEEAMASATAPELLIALVLFAVFALIPAYALRRFHREYFPLGQATRLYIIGVWKLVVGGALLFLMIRGSVGVATLNVGSVFHSPKQLHNQAAVNPCFSFLYACMRSEEKLSDYQFMPTEECHAAFERLHRYGSSDGSGMQEAASDSTEMVLTTDRPNIILILMESFSANAVGCLGGTTGHSPCIDTLAQGGILFSNTYASSFRTDRGTVATLSGYPSQPHSSIIKYPDKVRGLPGLAASLRAAGYSTHHLYGGDADFTNVRSYLYATGYDEITDVSNFPIKTRLSKWGTPDHISFPRVLDDCRRLEKQGKPYFYSYLTLSSHEPFDVLSHHDSDPYLNSVFYTDSCLGDFVHAMEQSPEWKNTLIIAISDHGYPYPADKALPDHPDRYKILMLWTGGAIRCPMVFDKVVSQSDLPATLLAQLGLPHGEMKFSKNIFRKGSPHFAYFSFPSLAGLATSQGTTIYNFDSKTIVYDDDPAHAEQRAGDARVMLQSVMEDMLSR
ncbi:LTA synthase family protein [Porphyromonas loveana]|uniref:LTA synthase family protein n=1 Tax=Porphyromonas loveana TaxID=1884669 RepID=UPI0035A0328F